MLEQSEGRVVFMIKVTLNGMRDAESDRDFMGYIRLNVDDKVYLDSIKIYQDERQDSGIAIVTPAHKSGDKYYPFFKITSKAFTDMLRNCVKEYIINPDNKEFVYNLQQEPEKIGVYVHPDTKKADMMISGQICIDSFRIMQSKENGDLFVSMPSIKKTDADGNVKYDKVVNISKDYRDDFNKEILDKYQKYSKEKKEENAEPSEGGKTI